MNKIYLYFKCLHLVRDQTVFYFIFLLFFSPTAILETQLGREKKVSLLFSLNTNKTTQVVARSCQSQIAPLFETGLKETIVQ